MPCDETCVPWCAEWQKTETRTFDSGATRGKDDDKLDYEGFLSPLVLTRFAEYMHECRLRNVPSGQAVRASDNWQKGMSFDSYMKSGFRHFMDWWTLHRASSPLTPTGEDDLETALCALLFNVQGYLHELVKARINGSRISPREPGALPGLQKGPSFDKEVQTLLDVPSCVAEGPTEDQWAGFKSRVNRKG